MSSPQHAPIPLVIDTDPGVDDAVALLLALASPEVELRAVTTVFGNVGLPATTLNARRLLALASRPDIPVAEGAARPLVFPQARRVAEWHGEDGLGGRSGLQPEPGPGLQPEPGPGLQPEPGPWLLPEPGRLVPRGAVALLADVLGAADTPVTIAAIGPLTNIALLLAVHPELAGKIDRLVVMGGSLRGGNTTPTAEFNVASDPEAAHRVLAEESVPLTLVPLDLTLGCAVDGGWLDELAGGGPRCAALAGVIEHYRERYRLVYGMDGVALHDVVAVLEAAVPGTLRTTATTLAVDCAPGVGRGTMHRESPGRSRPVDVAVYTDVARLHAEVLRRLRCLDSAG